MLIWTGNGVATKLGQTETSIARTHTHAHTLIFYILTNTSASQITADWTNNLLKPIKIHYIKNCFVDRGPSLFLLAIKQITLYTEILQGDPPPQWRKDSSCNVQ